VQIYLALNATNTHSYLSNLWKHFYLLDSFQAVDSSGQEYNKSVDQQEQTEQTDSHPAQLLSR